MWYWRFVLTWLSWKLPVNLYITYMACGAVSMMNATLLARHMTLVDVKPVARAVLVVEGVACSRRHIVFLMIWMNTATLQGTIIKNGPAEPIINWVVQPATAQPNSEMSTLHFPLSSMSMIHSMLTSRARITNMMLLQAITVLLRLKITFTKKGLRTATVRTIVVSVRLQADTCRDRNIQKLYNLHPIGDIDVISMPWWYHIQLWRVVVVADPMSATATAVSRNPVVVPRYVLVCRTIIARMLVIQPSMKIHREMYFPRTTIAAYDHVCNSSSE